MDGCGDQQYLLLLFKVSLIYYRFIFFDSSALYIKCPSLSISCLYPKNKIKNNKTKEKNIKRFVTPLERTSPFGFVLFYLRFLNFDHHVTSGAPTNPRPISGSWDEEGLLSNSLSRLFSISESFFFLPSYSREAFFLSSPVYLSRKVILTESHVRRVRRVIMIFGIK